MVWPRAMVGGGPAGGGGGAIGAGAPESAVGEIGAEGLTCPSRRPRRT